MNLFYPKLKQKLGFNSHMVFLPKDKYTSLSLPSQLDTLKSQNLPVGYILEDQYGFYLRLDLKQRNKVDYKNPTHCIVGGRKQ